MKKGVFALIFILAGMILLNSPPVLDQSIADTVQLEQLDATFELPVMAIMVMDQPTQYVQPGYIWPGGLELETFESTWSATFKIEYPTQRLNDQAIRNPRDGLLYSAGQMDIFMTSQPNSRDAFPEKTKQKEGLFRLDVGDIPATWSFQETYS